MSFVRLEWNDLFVRLAETISERSNCIRRKVGAIIVDEMKQVMSIGFNGTPSGTTNCFEGGCERCNSTEVRAGISLDTCTCIHADVNAVIQAGKSRCKNCILYCTDQPCLNCLKMIIQAGIKEIIYVREYPTHAYIYNRLLEESQIKIRQI